VELSLSQQRRFGYEPTELTDWIERHGYSLQTIERDLASFLPTHLDTVAYLNVLASPLQRKDPEIDGPARPPWNEGIDTTAS